MLTRVVKQEASKYGPSSIASCSYSTSMRPRKMKNMVTLQNLPTSATYADIRNLCFRNKLGLVKESDSDHREGTSQADSLESHSYANERSDELKRMSILRDIVEINFHRNSFLRPMGAATITFQNERSASLFKSISKDDSVGGATIDAHLHDSDKKGPASLHRRAVDRNGPPVRARPFNILAQAQRESPGRVVLLKGLPYHVTVERLTRMLRPSYQLANDVADTPKTASVDIRSEKDRNLHAVIRVGRATRDEFTSSFLVKLQTVSDTMRLVRNWHKSRWDRSSGAERKKEMMENERRKKKKDALNDQYLFEEDSRPETIGSGSNLKSEQVEQENETYQEKNDALWQAPLIIDATIMY